MKWFLAFAAVTLVAVLAWWQHNSVRSSYVNGLPPYAHLPGQEFIFQRDCYVFKLTEHASDWPLVGTHATVPALPAVVDRKNIGSALPGVRLLATVPTGTPARIVSVRRDAGPRGTTITFEILFLDDPDREYVRVDAFFLLDHTPEKDGAAPKFLEDHVVPRTRK